MIPRKRDYFFPALFPCTQGSRLVQEGRALPWYASLEGFLQATSRLFGCHWDCLKRICFCTILQGASHREKVDHPWALDTAFMHLSILRLRGWASACKLGVWHRCFLQCELTFSLTRHSLANLVWANHQLATFISNLVPGCLSEFTLSSANFFVVFIFICWHFYSTVCPVCCHFAFRS